ncbi:MAG: sulfatase [Thermoplasmata archaeon]|nr:sulfatase [Thermoplasmata archaeon]
MIVLDCVRAADFPGGRSEVAGMPHTRRLIREATTYRAVSPAPWTIPSHVSILTGLYPWEHGVHWKHDLHLDPSTRSLPAFLRERGYRSVLLSANPLLNETFGFSNGFDRSRTASWWEPYLRVSPSGLARKAPRRFLRPRNAAGQGRESTVELRHRATKTLYRYVFLLTVANRLVQRFVADPRNRGWPVAPWIEPDLAQALRDSPSSSIFTFINLLDAHEPYFPESEVVTTLRDWIHFVRTRQDGIGFAAGEWTPSSYELKLLESLYRQTLQTLDERIGRIRSTLEEAGRWENTLLFLTSDHGQAFGEHGTMFHMMRVDDELVRVPMVVKYPGAPDRARAAVGWASLIDIAPTILEATGGPFESFPSAVPLPSLDDRARPLPVATIADGIVWSHHARQFSRDQAARFDRVYGAAYDGSRKVVVDMSSGATVAYDIDLDPRERRDIWPTTGEALAGPRQIAWEAGRGVLEAKAVPMSGEVEERLRSWGYL